LTQITPRGDVVGAFNEEHSKTLRNLRVQVSTLPISQALFLAERVCNGELEVSGVDAVAIKEYSDAL
jgi:hypothetical protein